LHALRAIEEEGVRRRSTEIVVSVPPNVALYLLNQKRHGLSEIEKRYAFQVTIEADDELHAADCEIERVRQRRDDRPAQELARATYDHVEGEGEREPAEEVEAIPDVVEGEGERERAAGDEDGDRDGRGRRRRRRRRRGGRRDGDDRAPEGEDRPAEGEDRPYAAATNGHDAPSADEPPESDSEPMGDADGEGTPVGARVEGEGDADGDRRRRRGRRGGRRRRGREDGEGEPAERPSNGWDRAEAAQAAPLDDHPPAPFDGQPVEQMPGGHMPVEQPPFQPHAAMNTEAASPPAPPSIAPPPEPVVAQAPQPMPEPIQAQPEPPPPPAMVIPTISADAPPEKPKRGWWRR
jgi:ribonuclease E